MSNKFGKLKNLMLHSKDEEFIEAFNSYIEDKHIPNPIELAYDRAKLLYQMKEIKRQNGINRSLLFATWIMAIATCILTVINFFS